MDTETEADKLFPYTFNDLQASFAMVQSTKLILRAFVQFYGAWRLCSATGKIPEIVGPILKVENNADNYE